MLGNKVLKNNYRMFLENFLGGFLVTAKTAQLYQSMTLWPDDLISAHNTDDLSDKLLKHHVTLLQHPACDAV